MAGSVPAPLRDVAAEIGELELSRLDSPDSGKLRGERELRLSRDTERAAQ